MNTTEIEQMYEDGKIGRAYYAPSSSMEYFDGENYYNASGDQLRDSKEYNTNSEGHTPWGDE